MLGKSAHLQEYYPTVVGEVVELTNFTEDKIQTKTAE